MGEMRNIYNILVVKSEGKRPLGRPRHSWENKRRINLRENMVGRCGVDSYGSGLGSVAGLWQYGNKPSASVKY